MAENLLDILTRADRPTFTIDGSSYEMRHPNELSMAEFHQLGKEGDALTRAGEAYAKDPDAAYKKIRAGMNALLDLTTAGVPPKARAKLNPSHVRQIVERFIALARVKPAPVEQQKRKKSSRGSRGSTPARRRRTG